MWPFGAPVCAVRVCAECVYVCVQNYKMSSVASVSRVMTQALGV